MKVYKLMTFGVLLSFSSFLMAAESMDHAQHEQHSQSKYAYQAAKSKDGLDALHAIPKSGKSREAGFDRRYAMEPTSVQDDLAELCAKGSRGLIMLDRKTWEKCGGTPKGAPERHDSKKQDSSVSHQH